MVSICTYFPHFKISEEAEIGSFLEETGGLEKGRVQK